MREKRKEMWNKEEKRKCDGKKERKKERKEGRKRLFV